MVDEVFITQKTFKALVNAMSVPCTFNKIERDDDLNTLLKVCLTLLDGEVSFSVLGDLSNEVLIKEIISKTGSEYVSLEHADYVVVSGEVKKNKLLEIKRGTLEEPESGATIIYSVDSRQSNKKTSLVVSGPGIPNKMLVTINAIDFEFFEIIKEINMNYPLGVDTIFCFGDGIMCIPRSTKLEILQRGK